VGAAVAHTSECRRRGNGGTYHYYACSGRQKLGRKSCDSERLPKDKLEAAILHQLTGLYRDGDMIRDAIEQAAASDETDRAALTEKRASLAKEITRAERAIERYQDAFENGDLDPSRFKERLSALDARLDTPHDQDQALALELAVDTPTTPDTATLHAVADQLDHVIAHGAPEQAKALLAILIADLRINSRAEVQPTYRIGAPVVCAPTSSVGDTGLEIVSGARVVPDSPILLGFGALRSSQVRSNCYQNCYQARASRGPRDGRLHVHRDQSQDRYTDPDHAHHDGAAAADHTHPRLRKKALHPANPERVSSRTVRRQVGISDATTPAYERDAPDKESTEDYVYEDH
jgi:hypothetical protein